MGCRQLRSQLRSLVPAGNQRLKVRVYAVISACRSSRLTVWCRGEYILSLRATSMKVKHLPSAPGAPLRGDGRRRASRQALPATCVVCQHFPTCSVLLFSSHALHEMKGLASTLGNMGTTGAHKHSTPSRLCVDPPLTVAQISQPKVAVCGCRWLYVNS